MKCNQEEEQLIDYLVNALEQKDKDNLELHLTFCIKCQQTLERLKKAWIVLEEWKPVIPNADLQSLRQEVVENVKVQKLIEEKSKKNSLFEALESEKSKVQTPRGKIGLAFIGRAVMNNKTMAFATAAVIIVFVLLGINLSNKPTAPEVAWGSLVERLEKINYYTFKKRETTRFIHGRVINKEESDVYYSSQFGVFGDLNYSVFDNLNWNEIGFNVKVYGSFSDNTFMVVYPRIKKYYRVISIEEQINMIHAVLNDPGHILEAIKSFKYRKLESKIINGKKVEGVEINDPRFGKGMFESCVGRLWVDVETNLPVLYEARATADAGTIQIEQVMDDFKWDPGLDENIFKPDLTQYSLVAEVAGQPPGEETAVQALSSFSKMTGGHYPDSLIFSSCQKEFNRLYLAKKIKEIASQRAIFFWEEADFEWGPYVKLQMLLRQTCIHFYGQLVKEEKDVAYHGEIVTAKDTNAPLMRWKILDDEYRVLFGDLSIKDVSRERLAELEADLHDLGFLNLQTPNY